jgi:hypothetical protein
MDREIFGPEEEPLLSEWACPTQRRQPLEDDVK